MATRRKFGMSRSFLLRLVAVGVFVGLGTFAVIHSTNKKPSPEGDPKVAGANEADPDNAENSEPPIVTSASLSDKSTNSSTTTTPRTPPQSNTQSNNFLVDNDLRGRNRVEEQKTNGSPSNSPPWSADNQFNPADRFANNETGLPKTTLNESTTVPPIDASSRKSLPTNAPPFGAPPLDSNTKSSLPATNPPGTGSFQGIPSSSGSSGSNGFRMDLASSRNQNPANQSGGTNNFDPPGRFNPTASTGAGTNELGDTAEELTDNFKTTIQNATDVTSDPAKFPPLRQNANPSKTDNDGTTLDIPPLVVATEGNSGRNNSTNMSDNSQGMTFPDALAPNTGATLNRNGSTGSLQNSRNPQANPTLQNQQTGNPNPAFDRTTPSNPDTSFNNNPNSRFGSDANPAQSSGNSTTQLGGNRPAIESNNNQPRNSSFNNDLTNTLTPRPGTSTNSLNPNSLGTTAPIVSNNASSQNRPGVRAAEGAQTPAIFIEKLAPNEIQVNRPANFEIIVRNVGRVSASQVQVHDHIPQGTKLINAEPKPSTTNGDQLTWNFEALAPGQEQRIKLELLPQQPGEIGSVAQLTFAAAASVRTVCTQPELELIAEGPSQALIGDDITMNITVNNKGTGAAENVVIQEDVPDGLEFNGGLRKLEYPIGNLRPGESRNIQLRLKAAKVGSVQNLLVAHAKGGLKAHDSLDMQIVAPSIVTAGQGPSVRFVNREATHQFTVSNSGSASATNLEMIAKLPRGLKFQDTNNKGQYNPQTHSVYWSLAELKPNQTGRIEVTTLPVEAGDQTIDFNVSADLNQTSSTQQTLGVQQIVEVFFDIDDLNDAIEVGSPTAYELRVANQGATVATNVQLQIDFPAAIQPTEVRNGQGSEIRGQQVVFPPIPRLAPNQELKYIIDAKGLREGDHLVVATMKTDERATPTSKEESTKVYADR